MASTECMCDSVKHIDRYAYKQANVRASKFFISILDLLFRPRIEGAHWNLFCICCPRINIGDHGDSLERASLAHVLVVADERRNSPACVASHNHGTRRNCWALSLSRTTPSREAAVNIQQNRESSLAIRARMKIEKVECYKFHLAPKHPWWFAHERRSPFGYM